MRMPYGHLRWAGHKKDEGQRPDGLDAEKTLAVNHSFAKRGSDADLPITARTGAGSFWIGLCEFRFRCRKGHQL